MGGLGFTFCWPSSDTWQPSCSHIGGSPVGESSTCRSNSCAANVFGAIGNHPDNKMISDGPRRASTASAHPSVPSSSRVAGYVSAVRPVIRLPDCSSDLHSSSRLGLAGLFPLLAEQCIGDALVLLHQTVYFMSTPNGEYFAEVGKAPDRSVRGYERRA